MKPSTTSTSSRTAADDAAAAAAIATWPGDRPGILRLLECRLLHRADWEYLGSRHDAKLGLWPIDEFRCSRCERSWERMS
jgi:hypothetical protein